MLKVSGSTSTNTGEAPASATTSAGRREGEGRHEHRVARPHAPGAQDQQQRIGAIGAGDGVFHARPCGDVLLELRHLRTQNPLAAFHGGLDGGFQRRAQAAALGLQINKGDGIGHEHFLRGNARF